MFGPESGRNGWKGLPFVYDKVRIGRDESRVNWCERFLNIFVQEGCRMEEMSCKEHDKNAAESQFITHTVGRLEILDMAFEVLKKELFEHENKDFGVAKDKPMLPLLLENATKLLLAAARSLLLATEILLAVTTELLLAVTKELHFASTAVATTLGKLFAGHMELIYQICANTGMYSSKDELLEKDIELSNTWVPYGEVTILEDNSWRLQIYVHSWHKL
ncbi:hypothetical protein GIB67_029574 [Kingdonia uniflora]|uniref:Uncharacterized protein n=1 Tax=Kingdonia uniflora TaxID=39325 RepID=A0A7J7LL62_9MAGN|nr:hypothetical protein GIB67_029574 [Kingdonia uniflora]